MSDPTASTPSDRSTASTRRYHSIRIMLRRTVRSGATRDMPARQSSKVSAKAARRSSGYEPAIRHES